MPNTESKRVAASIRVLIAGVLFGTAGTAITFAPSGASTGALGVARLLFGALFLIAILPLIGGDRKRLWGLVRHPLVWVMAFFSAAFQPLFFGATERSGVALATLITVGSIPIFTGIVSWILLREKIVLSWLAATLLAIVGLVIRSWEEVEFQNLTGPVMALGAGLSVAFYLNAAKLELRKGDHEMELPAMAYLLGTIFLIPFLFGEPLDWLLEPAGIAVALYMGIVTMAMANYFQISGLKNLPPGPTATLSLADPLTATVLGVLILSEPFTLNAAIGLALVAIALIWQSTSKR